jgi:hypothetical protein
MPSNLSLHPHFQTGISYGQFAKLGVWEEAWIIKSEAGMPDEQAVMTYLADAEEVAFEVFFGTAFFGLRCRGTPQQVLQFALACIRAQHESLVGDSFLSLLSSALEVPAWGEHVEFAEVGAVNFWKSIGPYRVPDLKLAQGNPEVLLQALKQTPLGQNTQHPKAMELGCIGIFPHWFGLSVSSEQPPFALSLMQLKQVLALA